MTAVSRRIANIRRSGIREIFDLSQRIPDLINLGIGEPNFETPGFVSDAAKLAIDQGFDKYTQNTGLPELREQISRKLKRENGVTADPEKEIIVTSGATQAIFVVMNCLLNPGDEVLIPTPAFTAYEYAASIAGGKPVQVPLRQEDDYRLDPEQFRKRCSKKAKIIVLNSPCNPTGAVYSRRDIVALAELAIEKKITLVSDEIYERYLYEGASAFSPASKEDFRPNVVTINGFSKTFAMTGWRLGYAVATEDLIGAFTKFNMYDAVCAGSIAQKAGIAALKAGRSDYFRRVIKNYEIARSITCGYLDEMGLPYSKPKGAFYVFPDVTKVSKDSVSYCKDLLTECHVATIPGASFGKVGEGHIRLSFSSDAESLRTGLEKMQSFNRARLA